MNILHTDKTGVVTLNGLDDAGHPAALPQGLTTEWSSTDPNVLTVSGQGATATVTPVGDAGGVASVHCAAKHADGTEFPTTDVEITLAAEEATHGTLSFTEQP